MKRSVPLYVRLVSVLISAGITSLLIGIHAADLTTLGAHDVVATSTANATTASAGRSRAMTIADSGVN